MLRGVRQRPSGGMKKDIDPQDYRNGDYIDALNVRQIANGDNNTMAIEPVLGAEYSFTLPSITAQDKVYRIYPTPNASPDLYGLDFYDETGAQVGSTITFTSGATLADALDNCQDAIDLALSSYCSTSQGSDYVQVDFDTVNSQYLNYSIVSSYDTYKAGSLYSPLTLEVYEEAIAVIEEGDTYCIGSYDLNGDLFIMSANSIGTIGVISVAKRDIDGLWTLVRLLQSSELNFSTQYQIDLRVEKNSFQTSFYWTDDNNPPRAMYYRLPTYITDGFLEINGGIYNYDSIDKQSKLTNTSINVRLSGSQNQTGGHLFSGNYRYAVRLYDEALVPTEWSYLSGIIPVYTEDADGANSANTIYGATSGGYCTKVNVINVFNVNKKIYKYIELASVQYTDTAVTGYIVDRITIVDDGLSNIEVQHTGYETDQQTLDLAELTTIKRSINKAKNIELIDNRLVLSNLEVDYDQDLSDFAQAIKYSVQRKELGKLPYITNPLTAGSADEYQKIENVYNYIGYMINETYRFAVRVKPVGKGWTKAYWIDDITIDLTTSTRKLSGISDLNITDVDGNPYSYYIQFENLDSSLIPFAIEDVEIVRAECIDEVLCSGTAVHTGSDSKEYADAFNRGAGNAPASTIAARIYFPDYILNKVQELDFQAGDELVCFPTPGLDSAFPFSMLVAGNQYNGQFSSSTPTVITSFDTFEELDSTNKFKYLRVLLTGGQNLPSAATYGLTYVQYTRPISNKYGDPEKTEYITTGCFTSGKFVTADTFDCYGGDTFTQKTLMKSLTQTDSCMYVYSQNRVNANLKSGEYDNYFFPSPDGGALFSDVVFALQSPNYYAFTYNQQYNAKNVVQNWLAYDANIPENGDLPNQITWSEAKSYNQIKDSYRDIPQLNFKDLDLSNGEINAMLSLNGNLMTWQPRKFDFQYFNSNNVISQADGQEVLIGDAGVMSRRPNELSVYGTNHKWSVVKGRTQGGKDCAYWVSAEYKKFMRFGADGTVVLSDIKGMRSWFANFLPQLFDPSNPNYDKPVYYNGIHGVFHERFSDLLMTFIITPTEEGSPILSKTICFNEATNWFSTYYTPKPKIYLKYADTILSPSSIMDEDYVYKLEEEIFEYNKGDYCEWFCQTGHSGITVIDWVQGSTTITCDTDFYVLFNKFGYPEIKYFIQIGTTWYQVSSITSATEAELIESVTEASGSSDVIPYKYCVAEEGYIQMVVNQDPNTSKRFGATQWDTELAPWKVVYNTEAHQTTQLREEFETRENFHYCPIFNNELTGLKTADTTAPFGRWIKTKMSFKIGEYNKLFNFVITMYDRMRTYKF